MQDDQLVIDVVLGAFHAVETRDPEGLLAFYHPEVEFWEAPSLPYGGTVRGREAMQRRDGSLSNWSATWDPLQPTDAERSMSPRVVAARGGEVVVLWRQRAVDAAGDRFDAPVLGLYEVRDRMLARAQMFHFDTAAVVRFLDRARQRAHGPGSTPT
jgi:ketosteroid isomerase-like protein